VIFGALYTESVLPSVLWHCWLGGKKAIRPVKNWVVRCWRGYLSGARCRLAWPSWCHCHSLSLAPVKSRLVLPFWYQLTWVVPDKGPLNGCVCVSTESVLIFFKFWKEIKSDNQSDWFFLFCCRSVWLTVEEIISLFSCTTPAACAYSNFKLFLLFCKMCNFNFTV